MVGTCTINVQGDSALYSNRNPLAKPKQKTQQIAMKRVTAQKYSGILFLFLLVISSYVLGAQSKKVISSTKPCKRLVLYYHDTMFTGNNKANATAATIANPNGTGLGPFKFGNV